MADNNTSGTQGFANMSDEEQRKLAQEGNKAQPKSAKSAGGKKGGTKSRRSS